MIRISNSGEQIIVTYIWKMDEKGYIYLENQALSTVNLSQSYHSDFVQFLTSTDVQFRKYSSMFGFHWKNLSLNSQWYIKNECSDVAQGL